MSDTVIVGRSTGDDTMGPLFSRSATATFSVSTSVWRGGVILTSTISSCLALMTVSLSESPSDRCGGAERFSSPTIFGASSALSIKDN